MGSSPFINPTGWATGPGVLDSLTTLNFVVTLLAPPIAISAAVVRYRRGSAAERTQLRWFGATAALGAIGLAVTVVATAVRATFVALALLLQSVLEPFTQGQTIAMAAATLAVFALLQPVLRQIRRVVDRRIDRARYDAERISATFGDRLRVGFDPGPVATDLADTTSAILFPTSVGIWMRSRSGR